MSVTVERSYWWLVYGRDARDQRLMAEAATREEARSQASALSGSGIEGVHILRVEYVEREDGSTPVGSSRDGGMWRDGVEEV